jgi:hypothetical protein
MLSIFIRLHVEISDKLVNNIIRKSYRRSKSMNEDIINKIKIELDNFIDSQITNISTSIDFHNGLQRLIASTARAFGLNSVMEYKMCDGNTRNWRIDVVWKGKYKNIVLAVEIDSSLRIKSIKKLNQINAVNKIWVLYCSSINNDKFNELMCKYNIDKEIRIIYLGAIRKYIKRKFNGTKNNNLDDIRKNIII